MPTPTIQTLSLPVVRASSMKLAHACPASIGYAKDEVLIDSHDPTATQGTDGHRAIACELQGIEHPGFSGEDAAEMERLVDRAVNWYRDSFPRFQVTLFEHPIAYGNVTGTIDVLSLDSDEFAVADWKFTFRDDDYEPQLMAYLWLVFQSDPALEFGTIFTAYLRHNVVDQKRLSRGYVESWMEEFFRNSLSHSNVYRPGEHCQRCRRVGSCEAVSMMNRKTATELVQIADGTTTMSRDQAPDMWARVRLLESTIKNFRDFVREDVIAHGPLPLPSGKELRAVPVNKETIVAASGWGVLEKNFTQEEMATFIKIGKGDLEDAAAAKAGKGMKAKEKERILRELRDAKAVVVETTQQVKECSIKEVER